MRIQRILILFALLLALLCSSQRVFAQAQEVPLPNNKFGIHILFPSELSQAAKLVNSSGGDWGYVTIPIQAGDRDLVKWQAFMDDCRTYHLIPIIRLATEGDYFNTQVWRTPNENDVTDFANFLNSLTWPTQTRYVTVFNEVNRSNEWGGHVDPAGYAQLLSFAASTFHSKSPDFFIISAGMDNGADTSSTAMDEYSYFRAMHQAVPYVFDQIDGMGSHSYPNPAFLTPPTTMTRKSIASFQFEHSLISTFTHKNLPIFITETGWTRDGLSDQIIGQYYAQAFQTVWNDPNVIAVTPFLLLSGDGPFMQFSFLKPDGSPTQMAQAYMSIPKPAGHPVLIQPVLAAETINNAKLPVKDFGAPERSKNPVTAFVENLMSKWFFHG